MHTRRSGVDPNISRNTDGGARDFDTVDVLSIFNYNFSKFFRL